MIFRFRLNQSLESYLINAGVDKIIFESKTTGNLTEVTRKLLVRHVVKYMEQMYGLSPRKEQYISTSNAVICLFPCLKYESSQLGGIVSFPYQNFRSQ